MKKLTAVVLGCLLTAGLAFAGEPSAADQKWLDTVAKMVTSGEKTVSTPSDQRVTLLKEWAAKKGYTVTVTKTGNSYHIALAAKESGKGVAQK